jgi:hypothetical protein
LGLYVGPQEVAGFSINQVQPGAGCTLDNFIFVARNILVVVQPMLDFPVCAWAFEKESRHPRFVQLVIAIATTLTRSAIRRMSGG